MLVGFSIGWLPGILEGLFRSPNWYFYAGRLGAQRYIWLSVALTLHVACGLFLATVAGERSKLAISLIIAGVLWFGRIMLGRILGGFMRVAQDDLLTILLLDGFVMAVLGAVIGLILTWLIDPSQDRDQLSV